MVSPAENEDASSPVFAIAHVLEASMDPAEDDPVFISASNVENGAAAPRQAPEGQKERPGNYTNRNEEEEGVVNLNQEEKTKKNYCCPSIVLICGIFALALGVISWFSFRRVVLYLWLPFGVLFGLIACGCGVKSYRVDRHVEAYQNRRVVALLGILAGCTGILLCIGASYYSYNYDTY